MMMPFPLWTMVPFAALVAAIAIFPLVLPRIWERHGVQAIFALLCAAPVAQHLLATGHGEHLVRAGTSYASFVTTIAALYVVAGGIYLAGDLEGTPRINVAFFVTGAILANLIGTTGASMLLIRPFLRTNGQREHRAHLVPFFILGVSNIGGLLTPLGDPPLLLGYLEGVPFLWTLRLFPFWCLYVSGVAAALYVVDRRRYARETVTARARDHTEAAPLSMRGGGNVFLLLAIVGAALLPTGWREAAMLGIAFLSYVATPAAVHRDNAFTWGPISEVAILFFGLFACLVPLEENMAHLAPVLPIKKAWQLFWGAGLLSSVLDNAPTYAAFSALARGVSAGQADLVAGIVPIKLAAISLGSVVMGAMTYIGNGPNLMVKAIAERSGYPMPSFARYAAFACVMLLPLHGIATIILAALDP